jgi:hypothetical protein
MQSSWYLRFRVGISPQHLSAYCENTLNDLCYYRSSASPCVSWKTTVWGGPSDETWKPEDLCHSRCGTIKNPPCSKALSAEHKPQLGNPSPAMVPSPKNSRAGRDIVNNQSIITFVASSLIIILKTCQSIYRCLYRPVKLLYASFLSPVMSSIGVLRHPIHNEGKID